MFRLVLILCLLFTLINCKKKETLHSEYISTIETNTPIFSLDFINDSTGFLCTGTRDEEGFIYQTTDYGNTWNKIYTSKYNRCLYTINMVNDSVGYAGGDYMYLIKTEDRGKTWKINWFDAQELSYHEKNRPDIKKIEFLNEQTGYFVGGENYSAGGHYRTKDGGLSWSFDTLKNELKSLAFSDEKTGFVGGFGYIGQTTDGHNFKQLDLPADFYTGIAYLDNNTFILVSNKGAIYKYEDKEWGKIKGKDNSLSNRRSFNEVVFYQNTGYIIGNYGRIYLSEDFGNSWTPKVLGERAKLCCITTTSKHFFIGTSTGKIIKIPH